MGYQESMIKVNSRNEAYKFGATINRTLVNPTYILTVKYNKHVNGMQLQKGDTFLMIAGERSEQQNESYISLDDLCNEGIDLSNVFYTEPYHDELEAQPTDKQLKYLNKYRDSGKITSNTLYDYDNHPNRYRASLCLSEAFGN